MESAIMFRKQWLVVSIFAVAYGPIVGAAGAAIQTGDLRLVLAAHDQGDEPEREQERQELRERIGHLEREFEELQRGHQHQEAGRLEKELEVLRHRLQGLDEGAEPHADRIRERLHELRNEMGELLQHGRHQDAERLERQAHELERHLELEERRHQDRPGEGGDFERRVHHLNAAAENLRAAGMHEEAEELHRHAQQLERRMHEHAGARGTEELHRQVQELREVVGQLREEVNELRHGFHRLQEHLEQRDDHGPRR